MFNFTREDDVWFTSDWHFGHDKPFIFDPRGFTSVEEMNNELLRRHNSAVSPEDHVYVLGDLIMGDAANIKWVERMNGRLHIVLGNHDTPARETAYRNLPNAIEVVDATKVKYGKWIFYCTHWPARVGNFEERHKFANIHGHTHSPDRFQYISDYAYNIAPEAHNCTPVHAREIIEDIKSLLL